MSGPLARSAHMRMKLKREKGSSNTTPSPRPSPASQTVSKDLLLAAAVISTAEDAEEKRQSPPARESPTVTSPKSLSRSRSRGRGRHRGINSLETEGDYVVANSPSRGRVNNNSVERKNTPTAFVFDEMSPKQTKPTQVAGPMSPNNPTPANNVPPANPVSPTQARSIFNSSSPRHYSRSLRSRAAPTSPTTSHLTTSSNTNNSHGSSEHQQYDVSQIKTLQSSQRQQMESVKRQNEEMMEMHGRTREAFSRSMSEDCSFEVGDRNVNDRSCTDRNCIDRGSTDRSGKDRFDRVENRVESSPMERPAFDPFDSSPGPQDGRRRSAPFFFNEMSNKDGPLSPMSQGYEGRPKFGHEQQQFGYEQVSNGFKRDFDPAMYPNQQGYAHQSKREFAADPASQHSNSETMKDPNLPVYSPNHKDGSQMMTIEGHDDFVYCNNAELHQSQDMGGADFEYHTNDDEGRDTVTALNSNTSSGSGNMLNSNSSTSQTVDSEEALIGTPVKKKEKKKKHRKKGAPKFVIENAISNDTNDSLDSKRYKDARYAIHNSNDDYEEEPTAGEVARNIRGHSVKYNEIASTVQHYDEDPNQPSEPERKTLLPQRIGMSRSWDSNKLNDESRQLNSSKSWDAPTEDWRNAPPPPPPPHPPIKKQRNIWENKYDVELKRPTRTLSPRAVSPPEVSKSWDLNNDLSHTSHDTKSDRDEEFFNRDPFGKNTQGTTAAVDPFADWISGTSWANDQITEEAASDRVAEQPKNEVDWTKSNEMPSMIPLEFETSADEHVSDIEDDDDSIFRFKEDTVENLAPPPPPPANPQDIFAKLNNGLMQAESKKNRALMRGDASVGNAESDVSEQVSEGNGNKPVIEKRNVAFAKDKDNTIHTYLVEDSHFISSRETTSTMSTPNVDSAEEDTMGETISEDRSMEKEGSPDKIGSPRSISSEKLGSVNDSPVSPRRMKETISGDVGQRNFPKKTVRYQSDEETYNTNEESTMGSSFKSNRSGATPLQPPPEKEMNLLDHVAGLAASIGGFFGSPLSSPTNAADVVVAKTDEEKSLDTEQDDNTFGQSTLPSQDNTEKADDWFGYMEKVLFPTKEELRENESAAEERSVNTASEYTESNYTESVYTENEAPSSRFTYDDYADEEDDEAYLLQQALASARAVHHIHGVDYDESHEIDVVTDVKFHVANIKLPLGLLFQEHEIGAWVSRVVPDGNGARKGVQHGDQLASINGKSAVHASIDEVAATISKTPHDHSVELTFLRYVGPLRPVPGAIIQEGFEVTDSSVNKMTPPRPPKTKPPSAAKAKSRFFSKSPPGSPKQSRSRSTSPPRQKQLPSSPTRKEEVASAASPPDMNVEGNDNTTRSFDKKKSRLGKMMSFKKKK